METAMFDTSHLVATDETAEHAALYCLGDFSPEDRKNYEEHLSSCAVCRSEVEKYAALIADLAIAGAGGRPSEARAAFLTRVHNEKANREQWAKISSVLITAQLPARPTRKKNREQVTAALDQLTTQLSWVEQELLNAVVHAALELCDAGTAGFSVLYEEEKVFRWDAIAGDLAGAKGGTTPSNWSPCGTTLNLGAPQLFSLPSRCFEYFSSSPRQIVEGLVVPVYVGDKPLGTLWVASHDDRKFDKEDVQVLQRLCSLCSTAFGAMRKRQANQNSEAGR
jgi:GAF domain-containing protein